MPQKSEDDTESTLQHNLGDRETTDQHKAAVKKAVETIRKEGKQGDNNQTHEKTKNEQNKPSLCTSPSDAQQTSHQTETGEQMEAYTDQQIHGDSNVSREQPQLKSKTPPLKPKTAGSHTGETTSVLTSGNGRLPIQQPQVPSGDTHLSQQPTGKTSPNEQPPSSQESGTTPPHENDGRMQVSITLGPPSQQAVTTSETQVSVL